MMKVVRLRWLQALLLFTVLTGAAYGQTPVASNGTPAENFVGEQFCFTSEITNTGSPGYNPLLRVVLPPGISFNSVSFIGTPMTSDQYVDLGIVPPSGQITDPFLLNRIASPGEVITGLTPGSQVIVIQPPVGSVVQGGVPLELRICATIASNPALLGQQLPITVQPYYQLGNTPTGLNGPIFGSPNTKDVIPILYRFSKSNDAPRGHRTPGSIWPITYTLVMDIANGQTLTNVIIEDQLPVSLKLVPGSITSTCGVPSFAPASMNLPEGAGGTVGGTLSVTCPNITGTTAGSDVVVTFEAYVVNVLDESFCDDDIVANNGSARGTFGGIPQPAVTDQSEVTAFHYTMQHSASPTVLIPGQAFTYTIQLQVTEYDSDMNALTLQAIIPDGVDYGGITGATVAGVSLALGSFETVQPNTPSVGRTTVTWNVRNAYDAARDIISGAGNYNIPRGSGGTITYSATVRQTYQAPAFAGQPVRTRDELNAELTATYSMVSGANNCNYTAPTSVSIRPVEINKQVVGLQPLYTPGDRVVYLLEMDLPSGDAKQIFFEDFFPLPIFNVNEFADYATGARTIAPAGTPFSATNQIRYTVAHTATSLTPTIALDPAKNGFRINWGDLDSNVPRKISIEVAPTITTEPFDDGLFHTNFLRAGTENTPADAASGVNLVQIRIGTPKLQITKGIKETDNTIADPLRAPVNVFPIDANLPGFTSLAPPVPNIDPQSDGADLITYTITIENVGRANAYEVVINDPVIPGLTGHNVVAIRDGTGNDISAKFQAPFNNLFTVAGLRLRTGEFIDRDDNVTTTVAGVVNNVGPDVVIIEYTARPAGTVNPGQFILNKAQVQWKNANGPSVSFFPVEDDDAAVLIKYATVAKERTGLWQDPAATTASASGDPNFALVGEYVTYRVRLNLPEGQMPNVRLNDVMHPNLRFIAIRSVTADPGITTSIPGSFAAIAATAPTLSSVGGGTNNAFSINLGNLTNTNTDNAPRSVVVEYIAQTFEVNNERVLNNAVTITWNKPATNNLQPDLTAAAVPFNLLKPINVSKRVIFTSGNGSIIDGNLVGADAGDLVRFEIAVENVSDLGDAFDVVISDPAINTPQFTGHTNLQVLRGNNNNIGVGGTPLASPANYTGDLFTTDITLVNPNPLPRIVAPQTPGPPYNLETVIVRYDAFIRADVAAADTAKNIVTVQYKATPGGAVLNERDTASVQIRPVDGFNKTIIDRGTNNYTGTEDVNVGTILTYRLAFNIPEGQAPSLILRDTLDNGLSFVAASAVYTTPAGVTYSVGATPTLTTSTFGAGASNNILAFNFGTITNANNNLAVETIEITYQVVVRDITANVRGTRLNNRATISYDDPSNPNPAVLLRVTAQAPEVVVIAPTVVVTKSVVAVTSSNPAASISGGNVTGVDGGDQIEFEIRIRNTDPVSRAYDLVIQDPPIPSLTNLEVLSVRRAAPSNADVSGLFAGTVLGTSSDLFSLGGLVMTSAAANFLEANTGTAGGTNEIVIRVRGTVSLTVLPGFTGNNVATVQFAGGPGTTKFPPVTDNATLTSTTFPDVSKTRTTIQPGHGASNNVHIGELVTYVLEITVPEGRLQNVSIQDDLDLGLAFSRLVSIQRIADNPANLTTSIGAGDFSGITPTLSNVGGGTTGEARRIVLNLGTITNAENDDGAESIRITYEVVVLNALAVTRGLQVNNSARFTYTTATGTTNVNRSATDVNVVEQNLLVAKSFSDNTVDPSQTIQLRIDVTNPNVTNAGTAFDIVLEDILPSAMTAVSPVSVTVAGGVPAPITAAVTAGVLRVEWESFPVGGTARVIVDVQIAAALSPCATIDNTANLTWQSLRNTSQAAMPAYGGFNAYAAERTGNGGGAGEPGTNTYQASSTASVVSNANLTVDPFITSNSPRCEGDRAVLRVTEYSGFVVEYTWEKETPTGSGTWTRVGFNSFELIIDPAQVSDGGNYRVTVEVDGCVTDVSQVHVLTVNPRATVSLASNAAAIGCGGPDTDLVLTANVTGGTAPFTYIWTGPNGFSATTTTNIFTFPAATSALNGGYSVIVRDGNNCQATPASTFVSIRDLPAQPIVASVAPLCVGERLELTAPTYAGASVSYEWRRGATVVGNARTYVVNTVAGADAGTYTVVAIVDGCRSNASAGVVVTVNPRPVANLTSNAATIGCGGADVNLVLTSAITTAGTSPYTFNWSGPNGFSATTTSTTPGSFTIPNATEALNGTYTVRVTDARGCQAPPVSHVVNIRTRPVQPQIAVTSPVCAGETLTLATGTYTGASVTYEWFLDGNPIAGATANILTISPAAAANSGSYTVRVTVDGCQSNLSPARAVVVNPLPAAPALTNVQVCTGNTLNLAAPAGYTTYRWSGPNGFVANVQNPVIPNASAANAGTYTLEVTNASGCRTTAFLQAAVTPQPAAPVLTGPTNICVGSDLSLTATAYSGTVVTYNWTIPASATGAGRVAPTGPTLAFANAQTTDAGTYTLVVTVDGCTTPPTSVNVTVSPQPGAPDLTSVPTTVCEGGTLALTTSTVAQSYLWTGPNGFVSTLRNPAVITPVSAVNAGTYTLVVSSNGCTSAPATVTVAVTPAPARPVLQAASPNVCQGDAIVLTATPATGTSYVWVSPNGAEITTAGANLTVGAGDAGYAPGNWRVRQVAGGCQSALSEAVAVTITPVPTALPLNSGPVCAGNNIELFGNEIPGATYAWYADNGTTPGTFDGADQLIATTRNHTISAPAVGTYRYFLRIGQNGCLSAPVATVVTVTNTAVAPVVTTPVVVCQGQPLQLTTTTVAAGYLWSGPNGFSSTQQNPVVTASASAIHAGTYTLSATDGCGAASATVTVTVTASPVTPSIAFANAAICQGSNIVLSALPAGAAGYEWISPNGTVIATAGNTLTVLPADAGYAAGLWRVRTLSAGCNSALSDGVDILLVPRPNALPQAISPVCEGQPVQLLGNEVNNASYAWYLDNGATPGTVDAGDQLVTTNRLANLLDLPAGTYNYLYQVSVNGCTDVAPVTVQVNTRPVINIGPLVPLTCTYGLTDYTINAITSVTGGSGPANFRYRWVGPNGFLSVAQAPVLPNATSRDKGTYTVTVEDLATGCFSEPRSVVVDISDAIVTPVINFAGRLCVGEEMELRVDPPYSGAVVTYEWFFNGVSLGLTAPANQVPSYIVENVALANAGRYTVRVTVDGCTSLLSAETNVEVIPIPAEPTLTVAYANGGTTCPGGTITFTNSETADSYLWTGPNGYVSTLRAPVITNTGIEYNGTYTLRMTNGGRCVVEKAIDMNLIKPQPFTPVISQAGTLCEGARLELNTQAYTGATVLYTWTLPGGGTTTTTIPQLVVAAVALADAGNYSVQVTVDGCPSLLSAPTNLTVLPIPAVAPVIDPATSVTTVCKGGTIELRSTTTGVSRYIWTGPNGFRRESTLNNPIIIADARLSDAGVYELVVETNGCASPAASITVTVNDTPDQPVLAVNKLNLCSDESLVLTASPAGAASYQWIQPNGGTFTTAGAGAETVTIAPGAANYLPGQWRVRAINASACASPVSEPLAVNISPKPVAVPLNTGPVCAGLPVTLTGNDIGGATYRWYSNALAPANLIATTRNHTVNGLAAGTHDFVLVIEANGCISDPVTTTVTVNPAVAAPNVSVTANGTTTNNPAAPIVVCEGDMVLFAGLTNATGYQWSGPDGFVSSLRNPAAFTATLARSGTYEVLVTENGCVSVVRTIEITVNPRPAVPTISVATLNICSDQNLTLTTPAVAGVEYIWVKPNGEALPASASNVLTITPADANYQAGQWSVRIRNTTTGCTSAASTATTVNISAKPVAVAFNSGPVCAGAPVALTGNEIAGATYRWYRNTVAPANLIATTRNHTVSGLAAGTHDFVLVAELNGCSSDPVTTTVTVSPAAVAPSVSVTANGTTTNNPAAPIVVCEGDMVQFAGLTNTTGYQWSGPDGFVSSLRNPVAFTATLARSGTYEVLITENGCVSAVRTIQLTVNPRPVAPTISAATLNICSDQNLTLTASAAVGVQYIWVKPNGEELAPAVSNVLTITPADANYQAGQWRVRTVNATTGCVSAASSATTVNISAKPVAVAFNSGPVCSGAPVTLTGNEIAGAIYRWYRNAVAPANLIATSRTHTVNGLANGTHDFVLVVSANGCASDPVVTTATVNTVLAAPSIAITANGITTVDPGAAIEVCEGETVRLESPTAADSYTWSGPDGFASVLRAPATFVATASRAGTYQLQATVSGCGTAARTVQLIVRPRPAVPTISVATLNICSDQNLTLTASAAAGVQYIWVKPNGEELAPAVSNVLTITPADANYQAGQWRVRTVNATTGCVSAASSATTVNISLKPVAVAFNSGPVCSGAPVTLIGNEIAGATYRWYRNAVAPANLVATTLMHTVSGLADGTHDFVLVVSVNGCASDPVVTTATVNAPLPAASIAVTANGTTTVNPAVAIEVCEGELVRLESPTAAGSYTWSGPDGFSSTLSAPATFVATAAKSGAYQLLTTSNGCGTLPRTVQLIVNPRPVVPTISVAALNICSDQNLTLTASAAAGVQYIWVKPNGEALPASASNILTITPADANYQAGQWSVRTVNTTTGCVSGISAATTVNVLPKPVAVAFNSGTACSGESVTLIGNEIAGATYRWYRNTVAPANLIATTRNHTVSGLPDGTHDFLLVVETNGCASDPVVTTATVNAPLPAASVAVTANGTTTVNPAAPIEVCEGQTVAIQSPTNASEYIWVGPDGFASTLRNPASFVATTAKSGVYELQVRQGGCLTTVRSFTLSVSPTPAVPSITVTELELCQGQPIALTASLAAGVQYIWIKPNGEALVPSASNVLNIPAGSPDYLAGEWKVRVVTAAGCASGISASTRVSIFPVPVAIATNSGNVCIGGQVQLFGNEVAGATYQWYDGNPATGGALVATGREVTLNSLAAGSYTYWLVVTANGCASAATTTTFAVNGKPVVTIDLTAPASCVGGNTAYTLISNAPTGGTAPYTYFWTGPNGFVSSANDPVLPNVTREMAGTYTLVVTDAAGCQSDPVSATLTVTERPSVPVIAVNATELCEGDPLQITSSAFTGAVVSYQWYRNGVALGAPTATPSLILSPSAVADAGNYAVEVTVDGCTSLRSAEVAVNILAAPGDPLPTATYTNAATGNNCGGGDLQLAPTIAHQPGFTYLWSGPNGFTSTERSPMIMGATSITNGLYTVTITNGSCNRNSTGSVNVNFIIPIPETPTITTNPFICVGDVLELRTTQYAASVVTYRWFRGATLIASTNVPSLIIPSVTAADAGLYTVLVEANGCLSLSSPVTQVTISDIPVNPAPTAAYSTDPLFCTGGNLQLTALGDPTHRYFWTGPNGFVSTLQNPLITNASPAFNGTYTVTVSNSGCTNTASVVFNRIIRIDPFTPAIQPVLPVCNGDFLTLEASLYENIGTNQEYVWTLPDGSILRTGSNKLILGPVNSTTAGDYRVAISIDNCVSGTSLPVRVLVNSPPIAPEPSSNSPICSGSRLTLFANPPLSGGPFRYEWTGPNGFISNLQNPIIDVATQAAEGSYQLTITSPGGCRSFGTVQVSVGLQPLPPTLSAPEAVCAGSRLELTASTSPGIIVRYIWTLPDGSTVTTEVPQLIINNATSLNAGNYQVRTNTDGCLSAQSVVRSVRVVSIPTVQASSNSPVCDGGNVTLSATPATAGSFQYAWTGPNGFTSNQQSPIVANAGAAAAGVYTVVMSVPGTDCSVRAEVTVGVGSRPARPLLTSSSASSPQSGPGGASADVFCAGSPLVLRTATVAAAYEWIRPDGERIRTTEPTLTVASGTVNYVGGNWRVIAIDASGCTSEPSDAVNIRIQALPVAVATNNGPVCEGETVELQANDINGAEYRWFADSQGSPGALLTTGRNFTLRNLASGSYRYHLVVSLNGCQAEPVSTEVVVNGSGFVPRPTTEGIICQGSPIRLTANVTADRYLWTGPNGFSSTERNPTISSATTADAGRYSLIVTTGACESSPGSVNVSIVNTSIAPVIQHNGPVCEGSRLMLQAVGLPGTGFTYTWTLPIGITVTTQVPMLVIDQAMKVNEGFYFVRVRSNGCEFQPSQSVFVSVTNAPAAPQIIAPSEVCHGADLVLSTNITADRYFWEGPNGFTSSLRNPVAIRNVSALNAGEYTLYVENNGCRSAVSRRQIRVLFAPARPAITSNTPVCQGQPLTLTATAGFNSYIWTLPDGTTRTTGANTFSVPQATAAQAGNYTVVARSGECASEASATHTVQVNNTVAETAFAGTDIFVCDYSQPVTLRAGNLNVPGQWSAVAGTAATVRLVSPASNATQVTGLRPGTTYRFVWTIDNGACGGISRDTVAVSGEVAPVANPDQFSTSVNGFRFEPVLENDLLPEGPIVVTILRSPSNGQAVLNPDNTLDYTPNPGYLGPDELVYQVCLVNCPNLCDTAKVQIDVRGAILVPDIITPNNDGFNDAFVIEGLENYPDNQLFVYNRWGALVYETTNYRNDWFGTFRNEPLPDGTYYYILMNRKDGQAIAKGYVTIHR